MDIQRVETYMKRVAESETKTFTPVGDKLKVGLDLGTAYIVMVVLDEENNPIACEKQAADVLRDGVVVDYLGALNIVKALKAKLEQRIGKELVNCAIAMPAGTDDSVKTHTYVAEGAELEVTAVLDEPSAANAIYQNMKYIDSYDPEYVLILSGDHIYKMDYEVMLDFHKQNNADVTIAVMPVPMEEASRFGIVVADEENRIQEFQEKPAEPKSNLASMGIYIFNWKALKEALIANETVENCDFGMHVIPYCFDKGERIFAYEYNGYWKDVGTLGSYWEANMELIDLIPEFNLYEEYWTIYTKSDVLAPQYIAADAKVDKSIIGEGTEVYGEVHGCVIGANVTIGKGSIVRDSILMEGVTIGENVVIDKAIIAEDTVIGDGAVLGIGEEKPNKLKESVYAFGLVTIGEKSVIPPNVKIGKNTAIAGVTTPEDYPDGLLDSGEYIVKAGGKQ